MSSVLMDLFKIQVVRLTVCVTLMPDKARVSYMQSVADPDIPDREVGFDESGQKKLGLMTLFKVGQLLA